MDALASKRMEPPTRAGKNRSWSFMRPSRPVGAGRSAVGRKMTESDSGSEPVMICAGIVRTSRAKSVMLGCGFMRISVLRGGVRDAGRFVLELREDALEFVFHPSEGGDHIRIEVRTGGFEDDVLGGSQRKSRFVAALGGEGIPHVGQGDDPVPERGMASLERPSGYPEPSHFS